MSSPHSDSCSCAACSSSSAQRRPDREGSAATEGGAHPPTENLSGLRQLSAQAEHLRLFESVVLGSLDSIVITDAGNGAAVEPRILFVNEAFTRLSGYTALEAVGRNPRFLQGPDTDRTELTRIRAAIGAGRAVTATLVNYRKDGAPFHVETHIMPISGGTGRITHWVAIHRDIAERKKAETERLRFEGRLREMQKLESLGLLAGGIAHDFNNLLTVILGNATLARLAPPEGRELDEHLRLVESAATRAAELCRQMLAYAGRGRAGVRAVDFNALVQETVDLVRTSCSKSCVLWLELDRQLPTIHGDTTQLQQVVMNLVINATEAVGANRGRVQVTTAARTFSAAELAAIPAAGELTPGAFIVVEVRDTGCGMSAETKARIFEPFFTTKFTGRGLGLATVAGIVRGHHGALEVESEPGQGTCFRLLLPVGAPAAAPTNISAEPAGASLAPVDAGKPSPRRRVVLVIDDELMIRETARSVLEHRGFEVISAPDGDTGLALMSVHTAPIDAVLLDLSMPGLDGEAAFAELRKVDGQVPVLLMSGFSEEEATRRFAEHSLAGFLQKPFTAVQLAAAVERAAALRPPVKS